MYNKVILIALICFILLNKHFFYHYFISNMKILYWLRNQSIKKNLEDRKLTSKIGVEQFFLQQPLGISSNFNVPYYDKQYIFRQNNIRGLLDYKTFGKSDSLPHTINSFTTPFNFKGKWVGDSIFRMDYEIRENRKEQYLSALTKERVDYYKNVMKNHIPNVLIVNQELNYYDLCHKLCIDFLFILHLGLKPSLDDYKDIMVFIEAVAKFPMGIFFNKAVIKQLWNLQSFYKKTIAKINSLNPDTICIVNDWIKSGMKKDDIFIEVIHNIIGMVTNWVNTVYPYILGLARNDIHRIEKGNEKEYILECFRYLMPVKFISSKIKEPNVVNQNSGYFNAIHDLSLASRDKSWGNSPNKFDLQKFADFHKHLTPKGKCPFYHSKQNAKVPCDYSIYERDNYTPFGIGYRRCPGEFLSMEFLEEIAWFLKDKKIDINLKNGVSNKKHYVFNMKETNYIVKITEIN